MGKKGNIFTDKIKKFEKICRQKGIKITHQRLEIFREIVISGSHPSAEEIYRRLQLRLPMISLDTVYRTLSTFEHYNFIKKLQILDDRSRFDANLTDHHHIICTRCKGIQDFNWSFFHELQLPQEINQWGSVQSRHIEIRGICQRCLKSIEGKS